MAAASENEQEHHPQEFFEPETPYDPAPAAPGWGFGHHDSAGSLRGERQDAR